MSTDPRETLSELTKGVRALGSLDSELMQAYVGLREVVYHRPGALERKIRELLALVIGMCNNCKPCIVHHTNEALKAGASRQELIEAGFVALQMGGGPALVDVIVLKESIDTFAPDHER
jgi:AhpD family alkylhydroperoxidase